MIAAIRTVKKMVGSVVNVLQTIRRTIAIITGKTHVGSIVNVCITDIEFYIFVFNFIHT